MLKGSGSPDPFFFVREGFYRCFYISTSKVRQIIWRFSMATLQKSSNQGLPDWMKNIAIDKNVSDVSVNDSMTENELVQARSDIEVAAKNGEQYYYNDNLDKTRVSQLREYAEACGVETEGVSKSEVEVSRGIDAMAEEASGPSETERVASPLEGNPFEVSVTASETFEKDKSWEQVISVKKLQNQPDPYSTVRGLRGGEEHDANRIVGVATGQNSIAAPNAIGDYVDETTDDNREVIQTSNQERKEKIAFKTSDWESEKIAEMSEHASIIPRDGVCRVNSEGSNQVANVAPGNRSMWGDETDIPDVSAGEKLREQALERKTAIQRTKDFERKWDEQASAVEVRVSDPFFDSLKKNLQVK